MDKNKDYLLFMSGAMMLTLVSLSALGESRLEVYYSLFTVVYFASSALFRPRRRWFDVPGALLFLGFCYIVLLKIVEIIG
ncbi:hypothetical protein GF326_01760 [Candidatus Bathyarchaeota archaeon]|nr:hypothetical protein [Candidatus Bathyarchaeota archaeon]